jgi:hypothetical protein
VQPQESNKLSCYSLPLLVSMWPNISLLLLPARAVLREKLHSAIETARARIEAKSTTETVEEL